VPPPHRPACAQITLQRRFVLVRRLVAILGFNALSIARCCRCIAVTAALVHQPATVFAQVNMMLRGDPLMVFPYPVQLGSS
jgi:hypothetical protein